jgi:molybdopterin converting factor small subunit
MDLDAADMATSGGSAVLGAVTAAVLLRGRLRELLGLDEVQAQLQAMGQRLAALEDALAALRADTSGTSDSPRAQVRAVEARLGALEGALQLLRAEVSGRLQEAQALLSRVLALVEGR